VLSLSLSLLQAPFPNLCFKFKFQIPPQNFSCALFICIQNLSRPLLSPSFNVPYSFVCFSASSPTR
jgi:hypothetical protein